MMLLKSDFYAAPGVSRSALNRYFSNYKAGGDEIHTLEIFCHGAPVLRLAPAPYSCSDKREIYSLSKSFCSTAVGILVDAGRLSTEDKIVDLFPDDVPEHPQENLLKMRVRHVLSMNTGHPYCAMPAMIRSENEIRSFMEAEIPYEPGTHFTYNTGATLLLSHIVEKISGMKLLDFLTAKLFMPLGISDVRWNKTPDGANEGGCGIHVSADDIAKLGLLYLSGGVWNGQRLLSEEWVRTASSPISDNSMNGTPDWCSGYGYQFWVNKREGFRGDGAFGQLCVILPERDTVAAVQARVGDMQKEMDCLTELVSHLFDEDNTPDSALMLPDYAPVSSERRTSGLEDRFFRLEPNGLCWTGLYFRYDPSRDAMRMTFSDGTDQYAVTAGRGKWAESTVTSRKLKPKLVDLMSTPDAERCRLAASYRAEEGRLTFSVRFLNCPHSMRWQIEKTDAGISVDLGEDGLHDPGVLKLGGVPVE